MKTRIATLLLALLPMTFVFADGGNGYYSSKIEGTWHNDYHDVFLKIKKTRKGIKVRNGRHGSWERFDRVKKNTYDNCKGTTIKYSNRKHTVTLKDRYHSKIKLIKRNGYNHDYNYSSRQNSCGTNGSSWSWTSRDHSYDYYGRNNYGGVAGIWYSRNDAAVEVKRFSDGIKVRRVDRKGKWRKYYRVRDYDNLYADRDGNEYEVHGDTIIWRKFARNKEIRFYR